MWVKSLKRQAGMSQGKTGIQQSLSEGSILSQKEFLLNEWLRLWFVRKSVVNFNNNEMFRSIINKTDCKGKGY